MPSENKQLSFNIPIVTGISGLLFCSVIVAVTLIFLQKKSLIGDNHKRNSDVTYNLTLNYTGIALREAENFLTQSARYYAQKDTLSRAIKNENNQGMIQLMQLLKLLPSVSSITLVDTDGEYIHVPEAGECIKLSSKTSPWLTRKADRKTLSQYTGVYKDPITNELSVLLYKPIISIDGKDKGTLAFKLDLSYLSTSLRQMRLPVQGALFVINPHGDILMNADTGIILEKRFNHDLMEKISRAESHFYDKATMSWYYTHSLTNPDWIVVYKVSENDINEMHTQYFIIMGFSFCVLIMLIIGFGLYLNYASRNVLISIINAIQTGGVNKKPKLESMLGKAIASSKERESTLLKESVHDALTSCKNRRAFDADISLLMSEKHPFVFAMIDIDNFKSINDTYGHLVGDIVLRNVVREGMNVLTTKNISIYRYGGEEFAVIFPDLNPEEACVLLNDWRRNVELRTWREKGLSVTFSGGFGEWRGESLEDLISKVDSALYYSKRLGKNRLTESKG